MSSSSRSPHRLSQKNCGWQPHIAAQSVARDSVISAGTPGSFRRDISAAILLSSYRDKRLHVTNIHGIRHAIVYSEQGANGEGILINGRGATLNIHLRRSGILRPAIHTDLCLINRAKLPSALSTVGSRSRRAHGRNARFQFC